MERSTNSLCVEKCLGNSFEYDHDAARWLDGDLKLPVGRQCNRSLLELLILAVGD
jgi:hypothetical protein